LLRKLPEILGDIFATPCTSNHYGLKVVHIISSRQTNSGSSESEFTVTGIT